MQENDASHVGALQLLDIACLCRIATPQEQEPREAYGRGFELSYLNETHRKKTEFEHPRSGGTTTRLTEIEPTGVLANYQLSVKTLAPH